MNNKTLHFIMPMAGEGSRFKKEGYATPKPMMSLSTFFDDVPDDTPITKKMYENPFFISALSSIKVFSANMNFKFTFIVRDTVLDECYEVFNKTALKKKIIDVIFENNKNYNNITINVVGIDHLTHGALETVMYASNYIDDEDYVTILDCDIAFKSTTYNYAFSRMIWNETVSPMLLSFYYNKEKEENAKYSYARCYIPQNEDGTYNVTYVMEKNPISTHALGGCYFVGKGKLFKDVANEILEEYYNETISPKELYMSLVYVYYIIYKDIDVKLVDMNLHDDHYWSFGTPEDVRKYQYSTNIWDL